MAKSTHHFDSSFMDAVLHSSIVSCTNRSGIITFANNNFERVSGYSKDELIGSSHNIVNSGYHSRAFWRNMWRTIARGKVWRDEVCNRAKDGSFYWVDTFIYPYFNEQGRLMEYFSIRNNITDKKLQELEIQKKNQALLDIAWSQSHEMRRPVASILGLIQLSEKGGCAISREEFMTHLKNMTLELDTTIKRNVTRTYESEA